MSEPMERVARALERIAGVLEWQRAHQLAAIAEREEAMRRYHAEADLAAKVREAVPSPPDPAAELFATMSRFLKKQLGDEGE